MMCVENYFQRTVGSSFLRCRYVKSVELMYIMIWRYSNKVELTDHQGTVSMSVFLCHQEPEDRLLQSTSRGSAGPERLLCGAAA